MPVAAPAKSRHQVTAGDDDSGERPLRVRLRDGRVLAGFDAGSSDARPVFYFADFGATAASRHPDLSLARAAGVRLVSLDRPGLGASSRDRGRTLLSFARDVEAVADELGLDRFSLLGCSAGGAHALAVAQALPARVRSVGLAGATVPLAIAPVDGLCAKWRRLGFAARWAPWLVRRWCTSQERAFRRAPDDFVDRAIAAFDASDVSLLTLPEHRAAFVASKQALFHQGATGYADDVLALAGEWGFPLADVQAPVHLWHGESDPVVPVAAARWLAQQLPQARLETFPREGHLVHLARWEEEILRTLVS